MRQEKYQPFGDLFIVFPGHGSASDYRRELDLDRAIASVQYKAGGITFRRELFASRPDDVIVLRITSDQPGKLGFRARLETPHEAEDGGSAGNATVLPDSAANAALLERAVSSLYRVPVGAASAPSMRSRGVAKDGTKHARGAARTLP